MVEFCCSVVMCADDKMRHRCQQRPAEPDQTRVFLGEGQQCGEQAGCETCNTAAYNFPKARTKFESEPLCRCNTWPRLSTQPLAAPDSDQGQNQVNVGTDHRLPLVIPNRADPALTTSELRKRLTSISLLPRSVRKADLSSLNEKFCYLLQYTLEQRED